MTDREEITEGIRAALLLLDRIGVHGVCLLYDGLSIEAHCVEREDVRPMCERVLSGEGGGSRGKTLN